MQIPESQLNLSPVLSSFDTSVHHQDIFRDVIIALQQDFRLRLQTLVNAKLRRDGATAARECHALKCSLGEVTATSSAYLASIMERAAVELDWETFDLTFSAFQLDAGKLDSDMAAYLDSESTSISRRSSTL